MKSNTVFVVFVYNYDDETGKFVIADDPSRSGEPFYQVIADPDAVLREARDMIFTALIKEYKGVGSGTDRVILAMNKAVDSADATLIRLPHSPDLDDDVGLMMGQLDAPEGDQGNFAYVRALVVKPRNDRSVLKDLPELLLPAVNNPIEAI